MTIIAHLSDLHLNGTIPRRARFARALDNAWKHRPDHLVVTGDNTAHGSRLHHEELDESLAGWPTRITKVPGNHDGRLTGWTTEVTDFGDALLVPVDTRAPYKPLVFRALGKVGRSQMEVIDQMTQSGSRPVILAMHHGPQAHPLHVFDGLVDRSELRKLLQLRPWVHVLCGHDHRCLDIGQVHVAPSVAHHPDPVRIYEVAGRSLRPVYRSPFAGAYFT
jgi:3',5'-cyclic-AMP phosphodiesterase